MTANGEERTIMIDRRRYDLDILRIVLTVLVVIGHRDFAFETSLFVLLYVVGFSVLTVLDKCEKEFL